LQNAGVSREEQAAHPQAVAEIVAFYQDATKGMGVAAGDEKDDVWKKFAHGPEGANGAVVGNFEQPVSLFFLFLVCQSEDLLIKIATQSCREPLHLRRRREDFAKLPLLRLDLFLPLNNLHHLRCILNNNSTKESDQVLFLSRVHLIEEVLHLLRLSSIVLNLFVLPRLRLLPVLRALSTFSRTSLPNLTYISNNNRNR